MIIVFSEITCNSKNYIHTYIYIYIYTKVKSQLYFSLIYIPNLVRLSSFHYFNIVFYKIRNFLIQFYILYVLVLFWIEL